MTRLVLALLVALSLSLSLEACGKKGDPKLPAGKSDEFPREYPSE